MLNSELILYSFLVLFCLSLLTKVVLLWLNIQHIKNNMEKVPEQFSHQISLQDHQKAQLYTLAKNKFSIFTIITHSVILLGWLFAGGINWLYHWLESFQFSEMSFGIIFIFTFSLIGNILSLPEELYSTFVLEEKFGFNKTTPKIFITDQIKQLILSLLLGIPLLYGILSFIKYSGPLWWLYSWIFFVFFQLIIIWAYPKFIAPIFNKFTPLEDEELKNQIEQLCQRCKVKFKDYFVMNASLRSSHGNAYFTGFGKNKRIVFFDTLINSLAAKEVIAVLAHELGHFQKKHILKSLLLGIISLFMGLFILGQLYNHPEFLAAFSAPSNDSFVALLIFLLITPSYTYFITPIAAAFSRKNEFEADEFAAKNANASDLISALLKMYKDNSSSLTPHPVYSKFYFSHPPAKERVNFLESLKSDCT